MAAPIPETLAGELLRFHRVITRAMTVSLGRAREFGRGGFPDAGTKRGFLDYVKCLVVVTRAHHDTEDELVFPTFRERLSGAPFETLEAQHEELLPLLDAVAKGIAAGVAGRPDAEWLPALAPALERLGRLWEEHIAIEERHFSDDAIGRVCSPAEQEELGRRFAEHGQKLAQPPSLILPFVLFNLEPEERAKVTAKLPPPVVGHLIPVEWKAAWAPMQPFLLG